MHSPRSSPRNLDARGERRGFFDALEFDQSGFSRGLAAAASRSTRHIKKREKGLWQRRYWEHVIRDETDLRRHIDYIHFNPVKHGLVSRVVDWPHSGFQYVAREELPTDWGGDVREIVGSFGE